ncbi:MAG: phosphodiester glycosidase family protein [Clostridia bacterium]|nr:phosphodiester glycosidase family protein [Clostridia bacterium]
MNDEYVILHDKGERETAPLPSERRAEEQSASREDPKKKNRKPGRRARPGRRRVGGKIALCFGTFLVYVLLAVILICNVLLKGPSESARNLLVLSAKQASATKWMPELFLDKDLVKSIEKGSKAVTYDVLKMDDVKPAGDDAGEKDEWADAIDGIRFITLTRPTFKAYMLIIRDPARVFVGWGANYKAGAHGGAKIFGIAEKYNAVAAINGGEFSDVGGMGLGDLPMGLTFSRGERYSGSTNKTFMGFDKSDRLVVREGITLQEATDLGIRDGVSFQRGNTLITNDGEQVTVHYAEGNTGTAQRTCIAQRADGAVLMLVTDGRTAASLGATYNDCIEVLLEYGAVSAGMLDGGSSAMMYYRNYYDLYHIDPAELDEYQRQGLVNKYKAFTKPRTVPTYFVVGEARSDG